MGNIQLTISLVFISLFTVAIIGFAINFASDNNAPISIADDPELILLQTNVESDLSDFRDDSEGTYSSIVESSIETGDTTPSGGQFAITSRSTIGPVTNIFKTGYIKIFGTGGGFGIFLTTFISVILFIIGMYIWKTWAGRNPD